METTEINKSIDAVMNTIAKNHDKFQRLHEDYLEHKSKALMKEDYNLDIQKYATLKKLAVVEHMISMVPTIDKLEEVTFGIEQKIKKVQQFSNETFLKIDNHRIHHEAFKKELWKTFVLDESYKKDCKNTHELSYNMELRLQTCEKFETELHAQTQKLWMMLGTKVEAENFEDLKKVVRKLPVMKDLK